MADRRGEVAGRQGQRALQPDPASGTAPVRPQDEHPERDDLGTAAEPLSRIRSYMQGPDTDAEQARARRFLDSLTADPTATR